MGKITKIVNIAKKPILVNFPIIAVSLFFQDLYDVKFFESFLVLLSYVKVGKEMKAHRNGENEKNDGWYISNSLNVKLSWL